MDAHVFPHLVSGGKLASKLSVIARLYPQPWGYASIVVVDAILAFGSLYRDQFWAYFLAVYDAQKEFLNLSASDKTPNQIKDRLTEIAIDVLEKEVNGTLGPKSQIYGTFRDKITVKKGLYDSEITDSTAAIKNLGQSVSEAGERLVLTVRSQDRQAERDPCHRKIPRDSLAARKLKSIAYGAL